MSTGRRRFLRWTLGGAAGAVITGSARKLGATPERSGNLLADAIAGEEHDVLLDASHFLPESGRTTSDLATYIASDAVFNVKDFGAKGDGVTNDTAAIEAADTAATAGAPAIFGGGRGAHGIVHFPGGVYVHTGLNYRGAPWVGAGINATILKHYSMGGPSVNAVGTSNDRRLLNISDITFDGANAGNGAYCLRLGWNQRSLRALDHVRIVRYPKFAIYFKEDNWVLSLHDVYLAYNVGGAFGIDAAVTALFGFDWFNLVAENNGAISSGVGGIELNSRTVTNWNFHGGMWEGNFGAAEARFIDCVGVHMYGTYLESDPGSVTDGIVFGGATIGVLSGNYNVAGAGKTGIAFVVKDTAKVSMDCPRGHPNWPTMLAVKGTATVTLLSEGAFLTPVTVAAGAAFLRTTPKRVTLADAATIAVDASLGTAFTVTLGGNRRVGTPTQPSVGQRITFSIMQDGIGGRTLAWNAVFKVAWSNAGNAGNARASVSYIYDGTSWNQDGAQAPYV